MSVVPGPASGLAPGRWAVVPLVLLSASMLGQAVSFRGLVAWVLAPTLAACWLTGVAAGSGRRVAPFALAVALGPLVALAAEALGGETSGPITRSALVSVSLGSAAVLLSRTRFPAAAIVPAGGIAVAALGLGGAGSLLPWTGAWVVVAGATLAFLGPYAGADLRDARRLGTLLAALGIAGVAAITAYAVAVPLLGRPWTIPASAVAPAAQAPAPPPAAVPLDPQGAREARPPSAPPAPADEPVPPAAAPPAAAPPAAAPPAAGADALLEEAQRWVAWALALLAVIAVAWAAIALARRAWVAWQWAWLRRRLRRGGARASLIGAWRWARLRLAHRGHALPVHLSPDTAIGWGDAADVRALARLVAPAAFDASADVEPVDACAAWALAIRIDRDARGSLRRRWRDALGTPARATAIADGASSGEPALLARNGGR